MTETYGLIFRCMAKPLTRNTLLSLAAIFVVLASMTNFVSASSSTGVLVPLYKYPTVDDGWTDLINAKNNHPAVPVVGIVNPASGPCNPPFSLCQEDPNYTQFISDLKGNGTKPIGYVTTAVLSQCCKDIADVKAEIDAWNDLYPEIEGIFFDEMYGTASYVEEVSNYAKDSGLNFTVGNVGSDTTSGHIGKVDNVATWENDHWPNIITELRGWTHGEGWHTNYDKKNFAMLVHSQSTLDTNKVINASNHVAYIYVTDKSGANPYDGPATYIEDLFDILDVPSVGITIESKDLSGNLISGIKNMTIKVSNVLARNGTTPLFYNATNNTSHVITATNLNGLFKFHHWENNSTNATRIVTPIQNTTYTAFYNNLTGKWYDASWNYAKKITVDQTVIDSDLASFPLLVNITDADLGSKVQSDCDDILFTSSNNLTKLNHEIENCDMANNWLTAWVRADLSGSTNTIIFMYYGNSAATNQQNVTGTWKSSYQLVAHIHDDFLDSTSANNDGTNSGTTDYPNEYIADSQSFDGTNDSIKFGTDMADSSNGTITVWVRPTDIAKNQYITTSADDDLAVILGFQDNNFNIYDDASYPCGQTNMQIPATDDEWQLVAYSYSGSLADVHGFKNGTLIASDLNCSIEGEKTFLQLGTFYLGLVDYFGGQMDEFRFSTDFYENDDWFKARYSCELGGGGCITVDAEGTLPPT